MILSLRSCFEFAPSAVKILLSISRILQESDIDIEYFFRWKVIRVCGAQHGDCVVSRTKISVLISEM